MERFYHIRPKDKGYLETLSRGGATVRLCSIGDRPLHVAMQVSHCNIMDTFSKKLGRLYCTGGTKQRMVRTGEGLTLLVHTVEDVIQPAAIEEVHIRDLPARFARLWKDVHRRAHTQIEYSVVRSDFMGLVRDWLPNYEVQAVAHDILDDPEGGAPAILAAFDAAARADGHHVEGEEEIRDVENEQFATPARHQMFRT